MTGPTEFENGTATLRIALAVRFLLELGLLAGTAVAASSFTTGPWRWLAMAAAVAAVAVFWGALLAPRARLPMRPVAKIAVEALLVVTIAAFLWMAGHRAVALVGTALWTLDRILIALASRRTTRRR